MKNLSGFSKVDHKYAIDGEEGATKFSISNSLLDFPPHTLALKLTYITSISEIPSFEYSFRVTENVCKFFLMQDNICLVKCELSRSLTF